MHYHVEILLKPADIKKPVLLDPLCQSALEYNRKLAELAACVVLLEGESVDLSSDDHSLIDLLFTRALVELAELAAQVSGLDLPRIRVGIHIQRLRRVYGSQPTYWMVFYYEVGIASRSLSRPDGLVFPCDIENLH